MLAAVSFVISVSVITLFVCLKTYLTLLSVIELLDTQDDELAHRPKKDPLLDELDKLKVTNFSPRKHW